jgi:exosortase
MTPIGQNPLASPVADVPAKSPLRFPPHLLWGLFFLASIALFWTPLRQWASLSLNDPCYSHLILVPLISAFFFHRERSAIFSDVSPSPRFGTPFLTFSLAMYGWVALGVFQVSPNYGLPLLMLAIVLVWTTGFALCYGPNAVKAAMFPLLLLLLLVPLPFNLMDWIVSVLQRGSADVTYAFFSVLDVPMFRDGVRFDLPGIGIEIAKECSSIHSGWALFITGLLVGHIFLKSNWTKACLNILTVPIAMLTNAVRIVTLWFLGTKVDVGFLTGNLHRHGGILFSLISLSVLMSCLFLFRKLEPR